MNELFASLFCKHIYSCMNTIVYQREKQSRLTATIGTILFHVLLLLGLALLVLMPPNPPLGGGQGMTMSFGEEDLGGPSEIPVDDPTPVDPQPVPETPEDPLATQDIEEAPEVVEKKIEKKTVITKPKEPVVTKPVEKPRKVDERALFKKKATTSTASGYGSGDAPGNQGSPDGNTKGNPDGNGLGDGTGSGTGNGSGSGIGDGTGDGMGNYELHGRSLYRRPVVEDRSKETGKVVVQIVVDRNGKVIKATPGYKGSTTLNPALLDKARQGALDARFSARSDGPEEQYGTITFIFKFKP